jgi:hypothetical protein
MTHGVVSAYTWWNPLNGETEDPELCLSSIPHEPLGAESTEPSRLREELRLTTGERREDVPGWDDACASASGTHGPPGSDAPILAEPEGAELDCAVQVQELVTDVSRPAEAILFSSVIAWLQAETVF